MDRAFTISRTSRITKGGRKLSYVLSVIQQPERARACGSGAKSSSDRRPVDPPPVVELKIYNEDGSKSEDITFAYEANFFLYASLETARPTSRGGKAQQTPISAPVPILTGMPVSGTAYLDRPSEAGYFIFPDLSVRHEGQYILNFNLYEESKNEQDQDFDQTHLAPQEPNSTESSYDWRLEVKSIPFTVYSAKKFPGLSESTDLSKIVAEQGCRVRIRRDVRMRRRDQKSDEYSTQGEYVRCQEEDVSRERTRSESLSGSSDNSSKFSLTDTSNHLGLFNYHQFPRHQPSLPRSQCHFAFLDHHQSGTNVSLNKLPPPSLIELPPQTKSPYHHHISSLNFPHTKQMTRLPPVYPLSPPDKPREGDLDFGRSPVAGYGILPDNQTRVTPTLQTPIHPILPLHHTPRSPTSLSIVKLLSPINLPTEQHPNSCKNIPPISIANGLSHDKNNFSLPSPNKYQSSANKRSLSTALPDAIFSSHTRICHGQRPPSPLPHIIAEDDTEIESTENIMMYKRASGAIRVRQLPIVH
ncbi:Developmental and secondary metabolism regulator veA [Erysiphe necator]|uniref:Putative sexual development activator n=1 Tax=Uncinula necator TaxID=52586 RepID=A0A0B1P1Z4_UNCNE|nr:Developmental and secondary metabolism regulator veA [Erysiphe necator]KHJ30936.1 putative sexual development activator [Erysiphe necator]